MFLELTRVLPETKTPVVVNTDQIQWVQPQGTGCIIWFDSGNDAFVVAEPYNEVRRMLRTQLRE